MIRVYYLEVERIDNTDVVKGIDLIHNAILEVEDSLRKLIQDTTDGEHTGLVAVCVSWRQAIADEAALLKTLPPLSPPTRDLTAEIDLLTARVTNLDKATGIGSIGEKGIAKRIDSLEERIARLEI